MEATQYNTTHARLVNDDSALRQAIGDLSGKLARWTHSMSALQRHMAAPSAGIAAVKHRPHKADSEVAPSAACDTDVPAAATHNAHLEVTAAMLAGKPVSAGLLAQDPPMLTQASSSPSAAAVDDDEATLAALEPEVANAIRIRRRLLGRRVSIRELLTDYQLRPPKASGTRSTAKSWFGWGNA